MGAREFVISGSVFCAIAGGLALSYLEPPPHRRWCCVQSFETGLGACIRSEFACIDPKDVRATEQEQAACFERRTIVGDSTGEDCNPTMRSCELSRSKVLVDPEYDRITDCRAIDANRHARWTWYAKIAAAVTAAAALFLGIRYFPVWAERWLRKTP